MVYTKSTATISAILASARALFVEKSYAEVTISDIAAAADVSKGALYHHFAGKEDIYLQMMNHYLEQVQFASQAAVEDSSGSCRERLHQSLVSFLELPEELLGVLRLVRRDINIFSEPIRSDLIAAYQVAVPTQVERILQDGINNGEIQPFDARLLSWELVALVEVVLRPYGRRILGGAEATADFLLQLFLDGAAVREE